MLEFVAAQVVPAAAAVMMFCLGAGMEWSDLLKTLRKPRVIAVGMLLQLVLMPLLAAALCRACAIEPITATGLILIAASPVSAPATLMTRLARGSVALSVALTSLTSLLAAVTIPLSLELAAWLLPSATRLRLPPLWVMSVTLFAWCAVPTLLGTWMRQRYPTRVRAMERPLTKVAGVAFLLGLGIAIAATAKQIPSALASAGPYALLLSAVGLAAALAASRACSFDRADTLALMLGTGTRKFSFAAIVALTLLKDARLLMPGVAYGLLMWVTAGAVVAYARMRHTAEPDLGPVAAETASASA